jgi:DNA invertase Pin-like site-specific DNA recombinase
MGTREKITVKKYVSYYRVSTKTQGNSGLGLEAQRDIVEKYANGDGQVLAEFTEIESGRKNNREQLQKAISFAKANGATLLIAKLDRLARSVSFTFALRDSKVNFLCLDCPQMDTLTLAVMAGMAQYEAEVISKRTKDALAAAKARGQKLGNPGNLGFKATQKSIEVRKQRARSNQQNLKVYAIAKDFHTQGQSLNEIARRLNSYGINGADGGKFYPVTIKKLFALYQAVDAK